MQIFFIVLLLALAALTVFDILSTDAALKNGAREANPAMAWLQKVLGSWWWVPKAVAVAVLLGVMFFYGPSVQAILVAFVLVMGYLYVVFHNYGVANGTE